MGAVSQKYGAVRRLALAVDGAHSTAPEQRIDAELGDIGRGGIASRRKTGGIPQLGTGAVALIEPNLLVIRGPANN